MLEFNLLQKVEYLVKNNKVVLLRSCHSAWQEALLEKLAVERTVVNLADPMQRERALCQPEGFLKQYDDKKLLLKNIQFAPKLLEVLCSEDANYHCVAVMSQEYYIMEVF